EGAVAALAGAKELIPPLVARYQERRDLAAEGFRALGWTVAPPRGSMFLWLPVPQGFSSQEWIEHLMETASVVVTPGSAFGPGGEGYFRVSLAAPPEVLRAALERLQRAGIRYDRARAA